MRTSVATSGRKSPLYSATNSSSVFSERYPAMRNSPHSVGSRASETRSTDNEDGRFGQASDSADTSLHVLLLIRPLLNLDESIIEARSRLRQARRCQPWPTVAVV